MKKLFACLLVLYPAIMFSQTTASKADELLTAYYTQHKFSGNVLIAEKGKILFEKSYGMADMAANKPNDAATEFRIGSLTKMFTSTVILELAEKKKLDLDQPVSKYVPAFPQGNTITIRHLLSHTSGIKGDASPTADLKQTVASFKQTEPFGKPGDQFQYNNFNYMLLGRIAEIASGRSYAALIQSLLLKAGMTHTGLDTDQRVSQHKATGYRSDPNTAQWVVFPDNKVASASAAGAMYSTQADLLKWAGILLHSPMIKKELFRQMTTPVKADYGLGMIVKQRNGLTEIGHTGSIPGFIAALMIYPEKELVIILLSNYGDTNGRQLTEDLSALALGKAYQLPVEKKIVSADSTDLAKYVGDYKLNDQFHIEVSLQDKKLMALAPGDNEATELSMEANNRFFIRGPEIEIEFGGDQDKIEWMLIKQNGGMKLVKVK